MAGKPSLSNTRKRKPAGTGPANKKRKLEPGAKHHKEKGKEKAYERTFIPIPESKNEDSTSEVEEDDVTFYTKNRAAGAFLDTLDQKAISKSKKEIKRLHRMHKPVRQKHESTLPPVDSHDEDEGSWSSGISDVEEAKASSSEQHDSYSESEEDMDHTSVTSSDNSRMEEEYLRRRPRLASAELKDSKTADRLPIKLPDGRLQKTGKLPFSRDESESSEEEASQASISNYEEEKVEDVATGARFGRPAVVDVLSQKSRKARVQAAKEQLASICQDIVADPENSLGLLRRLHTFSLHKVTSPSHPEPIINDPHVRKLALLSQLAIFKDIIPGYRIRPLTEQEKGEKVSQMVMRTREYEQGLVSVYQSYLKVLENEIKVKSELAGIALQSMCTLLSELTHFNFRVNIMSTIVASLSRKTWDERSEVCLNAIVSVFRKDATGVPSLEIVRLLNRMIKERHYQVHPDVMSCLLHLRLKNELGGIRASESKASRDNDSSRHKGKRKGKNKNDRQATHLTKNAKKAIKENKEIQAELKEAEAEVDKEERSRQHTETLKLLFVLYFRILKSPKPTRLLPPALEGLSRYAHLVNVDFFRDLLTVLKGLIEKSNEGQDINKNENAVVDSSIPVQPVNDTDNLYHRLLCITTAFELLSGQGEALTIDLTVFINHLYTILLELASAPDIEAIPSKNAATRSPGGISLPHKQRSLRDLLFRALSLVFNPRTSSSNTPPWRTAAFAKRLLISCLTWPPPAILQSLEFIHTLLVKEPRLEALLNTEDRTADGVYRPDLDDPQLSNPFGSSFWELRMLQSEHWDPQVRKRAGQLANFTRE